MIDQPAKKQPTIKTEAEPDITFGVGAVRLSLPPKLVPTRVRVFNQYK